MRFGIVVFPGSNCDEDAFHAAKTVFGQDAEYLWHKDADLKGADVVILPGGFAHGDYLRTGAMARFSPIMARGARVRRARRPGPRHLQRFSDPAGVGAAARRDAAQQGAEVPVRARPRAGRADRHAVHERGAGRPRAADSRSATAKGTTSRRRTCCRRSKPTGRWSLRYTDPQGRIDEASNPNGSVNAIAGLCNDARNVVGMMPHPERACEPLLGGVDGRVIFESIASRGRKPRAARVGRYGDGRRAVLGPPETR